MVTYDSLQALDVDIWLDPLEIHGVGVSVVNPAHIGQHPGSLGPVDLPDAAQPGRFSCSSDHDRLPEDRAVSMELEAHKVQRPPVCHSNSFHCCPVFLQALVQSGLTLAGGPDEDLPAPVVHFEPVLHGQRLVQGIQVGEFPALDGVLRGGVLHAEDLPVLLHLEAEVLP